MRRRTRAAGGMTKPLDVVRLLSSFTCYVSPVLVREFPLGTSTGLYPARGSTFEKPRSGTTHFAGVRLPPQV